MGKKRLKISGDRQEEKGEIIEKKWYDYDWIRECVRFIFLVM